MTTVRIDKWLWVARFFKTRSLASRACELGRVESNSQHVKPSRDVRVGDLLRVKNDSGEFQIEILALSETRASHRLPRRSTASFPSMPTAPHAFRKASLAIRC
jgi:ribosomal 50S subunit-recycling heat shock protein